MNGTRIASDKLEDKRWPYYLIAPMILLFVMWMIIKNKFNALRNAQRETGLLVFDGIGKYGKVVKQNAAGWKAVDLIYNHHFGEDRSIGGRLDDFWFGSLNCQAARNRFKLAKRELEKAIYSFPDQKEIRIVSLASGTGQIESETIAEAKRRGIHVRATLIDKEKEALRRAQEIVSINGVQKEIDIVTADVDSATDIVERSSPHIMMMIAFLDYLPEEEAIRVISSIFRHLPSAGFFITSNTMPNIEMHFVTWVVGWQLIYRRPEDMIRIIKASGFIQCEVFADPLGIQSVLVARKS